MPITKVATRLLQRQAEKPFLAKVGKIGENISEQELCTGNGYKIVILFMQSVLNLSFSC
jgi:hypothetical protein